MAQIITLFWDIGGVILTNGWDHVSRKLAAERFELDEDDFRDRHDLSFPAFDSGRISIDEYLNRTIFYRPRSFSKPEFINFMYGQSKEYPETRAVLDEAAKSKKYFMGSINNEPLELNEYRIEKFDLRRDFQVFFSSCYLGTRKPEEKIFRIALAVTQQKPEECIFIDDRPLNLESPRRLGMNVIHHRNPDQLREELRKHGVEV